MKSSETSYEAEDAVDELSKMVQCVLDNHLLIAERLASIEVTLRNAPPVSFEFPSIDEATPHLIQRKVHSFAFEEELENSWVYRRSMGRDSEGAFSVITAAGRTASW